MTDKTATDGKQAISKKKRFMPIALVIVGILFLIGRHPSSVYLIFLGCIWDGFTSKERVETALKTDNPPRPPLAFFVLAILGTVSCGFLLIFGIGILLEQVFPFLNSGVWQPKSGIEMILSSGTFLNVSLGNFAAWAIAPKNLIGVQRILQFINGGVLAIGAAILGFYLTSLPFQYWEEKYGWRGFKGRG